MISFLLVTFEHLVISTISGWTLSQRFNKVFDVYRYGTFSVLTLVIIYGLTTTATVGMLGDNLWLFYLSMAMLSSGTSAYGVLISLK